MPGRSRSPSSALDMTAAHTGTVHSVTSVTMVTFARLIARTKATW